ncbi:glutathione peroxidase [Marinobacter daqiaonensis]|uniref:Glutathione peroxidase n=1 Tax=Marinobacter daqiaonensis TaxID=650891 RepID=A0A1I6GZJ3_9GAMM|nr:glutathione peroxidase [Marinobacter daqiaonensis]SFR47635.1 glutathione peroxidase [Marinobacter daqiaonensis]
MNRLRLHLATAVFIAGSVFASSVAAETCPSFLDHDQRKLHSNETINLCDIAAGKPLLVVNTASHCGYTGQFEGLQSLHNRYADEGLVVVGFASDTFRQEADSEEEAANVCFINFGVTFTMIAPSAVTGAGANPVFRNINQQSEPPRWNFTKYVIDARGNVIRSFPSSVGPDDPELIKAVESVL